jgi:hypothetical protein
MVTHHQPPEPEDGEAGDPKKRYGGFQLKFGDHDPLGDIPAVFGGKRRKTIFAGSKDAVCATGRRSGNTMNCTDRMVEFLRDDLRALGFRAFPPKPKKVAKGAVNPESLFDWQTEWAVREFQIAAAMPNVAVEDPKKKPSDEDAKKKGRYLSRLTAKTNDTKFKDDHPTGEVTPETARAIKHWLDNHYRCPVVIQAMQTVTVLGPKRKGKKREKKKERQILSENVWRYDEIPHSSPEMHAWDFSGYYDIPAGHSNEDIVVGHFTFYHAYHGPISDPGQCWPEAELSPQGLLGKDWATMSGEEKSTFRAVAAVGQQECKGYLDCVNFYDNCHGSMGPCHWTMPMNTCDPGELCGFVAFLESKYPAAFKKHFAQFGIWGPRWGKTPPAASSRGRPWIGTPTTPSGYVYLCPHNGEFIQVPNKKTPGRGFAETYWLRSWQSVYRMEMAARTDPAIRKAMWDYAARRIAQIRAMTAVGDWVPKIVNEDGTERKATLADVITSEQGMAVALRVHVRWSGSLTGKGGSKAILHNALKAVLKTDLFKETDAHGRAGKLLSPDKWDHPHEIALVDAMVAAVVKGSPKNADSVKRARYWPLRPPTDEEKRENKLSPLIRKYPWIPNVPKEVGPKTSRKSFAFIGDR